MQRDEAHIYFLETIGMGDWFWGTTLNDVRYCVEGEGIFMADSSAGALPKKVVLHFPTCKGGDVVEGYGIYNYLRGLAAKGVAIETRVEGLCASIAVLIALAADTVLMADAALWMVHKPASGGCGNADELRAEADLLDKIQAQIVSRYVARTGGKLDAATANDLINKESWLNADECIAYGFATGKLHEDPIAVPAGAEGVLNYFPTTKPAPTMAITPAEETRLVDRFINAAKDFFAPKNEVVPPVVNAATSFPATDDAGAAITLYADGAELAVDAAVFTDEALSIAAADGNYTLEDGREITVLAGTVSEMEATDAADAAATALAATNAAATDALTAEVAELKNQLATATNQVKSLKAKVAKTVPGSAGNPTPAGTQNITNKAAAPTAAPAFSIRKV